MIRSRIRRLERRSEGSMVRVRQRDGSMRTFSADDFWRQLFISEAAAFGRSDPSAASLAMEGATEEARAEIRAMLEREGGEFLKVATADGFGNIEPEVMDLSETS